MPTLTEVSKKRDEAAGAIKELWDKGIVAAKNAGGDGKDPSFTADQLTEFQSRNEELTTVTKEWESLKMAHGSAELAARIAAESGKPALPFAYPGGAIDDRAPRNASKSIGQLFVESKGYGAFKESDCQNKDVKVDLTGVSVKEAMGAFKTTVQETGPGYAPVNARTNVVIPAAIRRPVVADFIPQTETGLSIVKYMEQTTDTNAAASVAETAAMAESAMAWTERNAIVEMIGTYIPVTEQQLADVPSVRDLIDQRLMLFLRLKEEDMILGGNGTSPQITGFYNKAGIQTQALGSDSRPDAVFKLFQTIRYTGFADPSVIFFNPTDWTNIRLLKDTQGRYIWGDPSTQGLEQIWGVPVVQTPAATLATPITGDFTMYSHISRNQGAQIAIGYINDQFVKNLLTIKINSRLALEIYRAGAFGTGTGF